MSLWHSTLTIPFDSSTSSLLRANGACVAIIDFLSFMQSPSSHSVHPELVEEGIAGQDRLAEA